MNEIKVVIESPVLTNSGYGRRSADFIKALHKTRPDFKLHIIPIRWGNTSWDGLDKNDNSNDVIFNNLTEFRLVKGQPDIHIQITVPNEARPIGKYNIMITAGIETTLASHQWIAGCNKMDLVLVSSEHSKKTFFDSVFKEIDNKTQKQISELKITSPCEVLFEGYDETTFFKTKTIEPTITELFNKIEPQFNFLFVGHWLPGVIGEDRKDVGMLVKTFLNKFKDVENAPGLILKTSTGVTSRIDYYNLQTKINDIKKTISYKKSLPVISIVHGSLTNSEMNSLYNHPNVKAFVSFTKGEGYNRPCLESCVTKKPILVSEFSGHLDFLTPAGTILLDGELKNVHKSVVWDNVIIPESKWFTVNYDNAANIINDVFINYNKHINKSRKNTQYKSFTFDKMVERIDYLFTKYIPANITSKEIKLNL